MTNGSTPSFFEGLKITSWYKYVAYISGVTLILSFFLDTKIETAKILNFSTYSIAISLFNWVIDWVIEVIATYYDEKFSENRHSSEEFEAFKIFAVVETTITVGLFIIWMLFILRPLIT